MANRASELKCVFSSDQERYCCAHFYWGKRAWYCKDCESHFFRENKPSAFHCLDGCYCEGGFSTTRVLASQGETFILTRFVRNNWYLGIKQKAKMLSSKKKIDFQFCTWFLKWKRLLHMSNRARQRPCWHVTIKFFGRYLNNTDQFFSCDNATSSSSCARVNRDGNTLST